MSVASVQRGRRQVGMNNADRIAAHEPAVNEMRTIFNNLWHLAWSDPSCHVFECPLLNDVSEYINVFAMTHERGLSIISADVTHAQPDQWNLQISTSAAFEVPYNDAVAEWVNDRNRRTSYGKYYFTIGQSGAASIIWEISI